MLLSIRIVDSKMTWLTIVILLMSIDDLSDELVPDVFWRKILFILYNIVLYASTLIEMMASEVIRKYNLLPRKNIRMMTTQTFK
jgi:hypothetical protein